jgi:hypothetical protein
MGFLKTFDFEIFLSYGWAGTTDEDQGARWWARQLRDSLEKWLAVNLGHPRIYFDADASRVGPFPNDIYDALKRSALLVFAVSPGSYRTNSWCQKEVAAFWDFARPLAKAKTVMAPEDRILKVIQSPPSVTPEKEPLALRELRTFDLFDWIETGPDKTPEAADLSQPSQKVQSELERLYAALRKSLERVQEIEETYRPSGKRIFLGPTFSEADQRYFRELRRELLLDGHEVRSVTPLPADAETADEHRWRLAGSLERATLAVHSVPRAVPNSGWERNVAAQQIRHCLLKSKADKAFSVFLWQDPDVKDFDPQCLQEIHEIGPSVGDQIVEWTIFTDFKVNVEDILRKTQVPQPDRPYDIVIQHLDEDSPDANLIKKYLKDRHQLAAFANPTLPKKHTVRTRNNNKKYYQSAKAFVVLYGQTDNEWANDICTDMAPYISGREGGLVVLAPPTEPPKAKQFYAAPDEFRFATKPCFDRQYAGAIDDWLGRSALASSAGNGHPR